MIPLVREEKYQLKGNDHFALQLAIRELLEAKKLSSTNAKLLFVQVAGNGALPASIEKYAEEQGFIQESDEGAIEAIVQQVLADNPKAAEDVKNGEVKAIGFLVGQVMKQSRGQANPQTAQQLIRKALQL